MKAHRPSRAAPQTFVLKYLEVPGSRGPVFRPMVPMVLSWRGHPLEVSMFLDTGSDSTFLRTSLARELGLEAGPPDRHVRGAGPGKSAWFPASPSKVYGSIDHVDTSGKRGRPHLLDPVTIPVSDEALPMSVLGREPFMEAYEIIIRQKQREFVLRELH